MQLKVAFVTSDAEFDATTTPNMDVKVVGQPDAATLEKDNPVHFTGTLVSYDPDPAFMLHWDKAKVNEEDIPKEKGAPKKTPAKAPRREAEQLRATRSKLRNGSPASRGAVFYLRADIRSEAGKALVRAVARRREPVSESSLYSSILRLSVLR